MSVSLEISNGIAVVTMDDGKANAVNHQLLDELEPALDEAEAKADATILAGRDGKFCAGFDLKIIRESDAEAVTRLTIRGGGMVPRLYGFRRPLIAASTGHCMALGALWVLACDVRIGRPGPYKYGLNESAIGLDLPEFGTEIAKARIPPSHLTQAVVLSRIYNPAEAVEAGFLDELAADDDVLQVALAHAERLAQLPAGAFDRNKLRLRHDTLHAIRQSFEAYGA